MPDQRLIRLLTSAQRALGRGELAIAAEMIRCSLDLAECSSAEAIRLAVHHMDVDDEPDVTTYEITVEAGRAELRDVDRHGRAERGPSTYLRVAGRERHEIKLSVEVA